MKFTISFISKLFFGMFTYWLVLQDTKDANLASTAAIIVTLLYRV